MKYGEWTFGQTEALLNKLGEENAKKLLRGDVSIQWVEENSIFDETGRRIPSSGIIIRRSEQGEIEITAPDNRNVRIAFDILADSGLGKSLSVPFDQFLRKVVEIRMGIIGDKRLSNLEKGPAFPLILPQAQINDYGSLMLKRYLPPLANSLLIKGMRFSNNIKLENAVQPISGHKKVFEALQQTHVIGVYYPRAFEGYVMQAARARASDLPENVSLAGGVDTIAAMIAYPGFIKEMRYCMPGVMWGDDRHHIRIDPQGSDLKLDVFGNHLDRPGVAGVFVR